jgi:hypothetical protein
MRAVAESPESQAGYDEATERLIELYRSARTRVTELTAAFNEQAGRNQWVETHRLGDQIALELQRLRIMHHRLMRANISPECLS